MRNKKLLLQLFSLCAAIYTKIYRYLPEIANDSIVAWRLSMCGWRQKGNGAKHVAFSADEMPQYVIIYETDKIIWRLWWASPHIWLPVHNSIWNDGTLFTIVSHISEKVNFWHFHSNKQTRRTNYLYQFVSNLRCNEKAAFPNSTNVFNGSLKAWMLLLPTQKIYHNRSHWLPQLLIVILIRLDMGIVRTWGLSSPFLSGNLSIYWPAVAHNKRCGNLAIRFCEQKIF